MAKTAEQIAVALNVSITTVRLVLNDQTRQYRISSKTQALINEYVAEHGYTVNYAARSLKRNKTDTLGLIIPRLSDTFFATLAEKLESRCRIAGYQLMISCSNNDPQSENKLVDDLIARNVDGLFVVPSSLNSQNHYLKNMPRPLVFLDRDFGTAGVPLVVSDNQQGSEALTEAMYAASQQPPFFMAGDLHHTAIKSRLHGFEAVLKAKGVANPVQWILEASHNHREDGEALMRRYLDIHHTTPPAFIASSLTVLEGALNVLREAFGHIPASLNIGTFDEHPMLSFLPNNIWSVRQDEEAWVEMAFKTMRQSLLGDSEINGGIVPMKLIYRERAHSFSGGHYAP